MPDLYNRKEETRLLD